MNSILAASVFLIRIKKLIEQGKLSFSPRNVTKTYQFLINEHFLISDVLNYVYNLNPENYYCGPSPDDNGTSGDIMVFLKPYKNTQIYIKLKIWQENNEEEGTIMSFHEECQYD